jgi:xanthine dehydrogenase YagS FAD-binding subunit
MHPFAVSRADDTAEAIAAHALDPKLAFIAGGTDLIGLMKDRALFPERLLDINHLPGLERIEALPGGGVRIGALARMNEVAADTEVRRRFPLVAEALLLSASGQLRNMASIGGNIMQRTRCAYFRDETGGRCNKRAPGSGCAALHGLNRNHAIFGWSESCVATNPSDLAVALAALNALVIVQGRAGEHQIPFADFHCLPGGAPERDNVLDRGDLIVAIEVPASVEARASHYLKIRDRFL